MDALGKSDSVHYLMLPEYEEGRLDPACEVRDEGCVSVHIRQRWANWIWGVRGR